MDNKLLVGTNREEVLEGVDKLKTGKTCGEDNIEAEMIKWGGRTETTKLSEKPDGPSPFMAVNGVLQNLYKTNKAFRPQRQINYNISILKNLVGRNGNA